MNCSCTGMLHTVNINRNVQPVIESVTLYLHLLSAHTVEPLSLIFFTFLFSILLYITAHIGWNAQLTLPAKNIFTKYIWFINFCNTLRCLSLQVAENLLTKQKIHYLISTFQRATATPGIKISIALNWIQKCHGVSYTQLVISCNIKCQYP